MIIEVVFIAIVGAIIGALLWFIDKLGLGFKQKKQATLKKINEHIANLDIKINSQDAEGVKNALMEIDKLFDYALIQMLYKGTTMADRMNAASNKYDKNEFNKIWEAHKLRNRLVHEIDFKPNLNEIAKQYQTIKQAIYKLLK